MRVRLTIFPRVLALGAMFATLGAPACWAQTPMSNGGVGPPPNLSGQSQIPGRAPPRQLPPALPGAKSDPNTVAPATKQASEMSPTDALFDAINRGDMGAARDAVNRGADLDGRNVLGMTPLELSIDLSRNDISFMLLSMRGGGDSVAHAPAPPEKPGSRKPARDIFTARMTAPAPRVTAPPPPRVARLFSGDGGAPVPASGFLGFDTAGRN